MKGIDTMVAAVLVIVISMSIIGVVLSFGLPAIQKSQDTLVYEEAKNNVLRIDSAIKSVAGQGNGSAEDVLITSSGGLYTVYKDSDNITFSMETSLYGNMQRNESSAQMVSKDGLVTITESYTKVDLVKDQILGKGPWRLIVRSLGWNTTSDKAIVQIDVV